MPIRAQYFLFLVNGALLGIVAVVLQRVLFWLLGSDTGFIYAVASALTYAPLIVLNFVIQRALIFTSRGRFLRFVLANLFIMSAVSLLSPLTRYLLTLLFGAEFGDNGGFMFAALLAATPSFLLAKYWVFRSA